MHSTIIVVNIGTIKVRHINRKPSTYVHNFSIKGKKLFHTLRYLINKIKQNINQIKTKKYNFMWDGLQLERVSSLLLLS